jgi:hypothetical protein
LFFAWLGLTVVIVTTLSVFLPSPGAACELAAEFKRPTSHETVDTPQTSGPAVQPDTPQVEGTVATDTVQPDTPQVEGTVATETVQPDTPQVEGTVATETVQPDTPQVEGTVGTETGVPQEALDEYNTRMTSHETVDTQTSSPTVQPDTPQVKGTVAMDTGGPQEALDETVDTQTISPTAEPDTLQVKGSTVAMEMPQVEGTVAMETCPATKDLDNRDGVPVMEQTISPAVQPDTPQVKGTVAMEMPQVEGTVATETKDLDKRDGVPVMESDITTPESGGSIQTSPAREKGNPQVDGSVAMETSPIQKDVHEKMLVVESDIRTPDGGSIHTCEEESPPHMEGQEAMETSPTQRDQSDTSGGLFKGMRFVVCPLQKKMRRFHGKTPIADTLDFITSEGGIVLQTLPEDITDTDRVYVLSKGFPRKTLYYNAIASGIPCISFKWIDRCRAKMKIRRFKKNLFGVPSFQNRYIPQRPGKHHLGITGMTVALALLQDRLHDEYCDLLLRSGCCIQDGLPTRDTSVMIVDHDGTSVPKFDQAIQAAKDLGIPMVDGDWLIFSLMYGKRLPFKDYPVESEQGDPDQDYAHGSTHTHEDEDSTDNGLEITVESEQGDPDQDYAHGSTHTHEDEDSTDNGLDLYEQGNSFNADTSHAPEDLMDHDSGDESDPEDLMDKNSAIQLNDILSAPLDLKVEAMSGQRVLLSWKPPMEHSSCSELQYEVYIGMRNTTNLTMAGRTTSTEFLLHTNPGAVMFAVGALAIGTLGQRRQSGFAYVTIEETTPAQDDVQAFASSILIPGLGDSLIRHSNAAFTTRRFSQSGNSSSADDCGQQIGLDSTQYETLRLVSYNKITFGFTVSVKKCL